MRVHYTTVPNLAADLVYAYRSVRHYGRMYMYYGIGQIVFAESQR